MRNIAVLFMLALILGVVSLAQADEFVSVLVGGDQTTVVDSITLKRTGRNPVSFHTPGFVANLGEEDTANIGTQPWPGEYIRVSYLYGLTRQVPVTFSTPVRDSWYDLPGTSTPARIKFLLVGGVEEAEHLSRALPRMTVTPNPVCGHARVDFSLGQQEPLHALVLNSTGKVVRTLASGVFAAGSHTLGWNGRDNTGARLEPGVYYLHLSADRTLTAKIVLTD